MNKLFPNWHLNETGRIKYFHAVNIPADQIRQSKSDLANIANDIKINHILQKGL